MSHTFKPSGCGALCRSQTSAWYGRNCCVAFKCFVLNTEVSWAPCDFIELWPACDQVTSWLFTMHQSMIRASGRGGAFSKGLLSVVCIRVWASGLAERPSACFLWPAGEWQHLLQLSKRLHHPLCCDLLALSLSSPRNKPMCMQMTRAHWGSWDASISEPFVTGSHKTWAARTAHSLRSGWNN